MRRFLEKVPYSTSSETKIYMKLVCKQENNENIIDILIFHYIWFKKKWTGFDI